MAKRGNYRRQDLQLARRVIWRRAIFITSSLGGLLLVFWAWQVWQSASILPLRTVHITGNGDISFLQPEEVESTVTAHLQGNFFSLNMDAVRRQVESLPWVASAGMSRQWPDTLYVTVREHQPRWRWQGLESSSQKGLVSQQGVLFFPQNIQGFQHLPLLLSTENDYGFLLRLFQEMQEIVDVLGMPVAKLRMDERRAIIVNLQQGPELILGRSDIMARLSRFVAVYPHIRRPHNKTLLRADLRYTSGLAIRWSS
jgi:cell division protein FtsQ